MTPGGGKSIHGIGRVFFLKATQGSSPHRAVEELLSAQNVRAALIHGIGGFRRARLAVYSPTEGRYYEATVEARPGRVVEVASLTGNSVQGPDGRFYIHLHAVLAVETDRVYAGHLVDAEVDPFLELAVLELVGGYESLAALLSHRWAGQGTRGAPSSSGSSP